MLRFHAESTPRMVNPTAFARDFTVEKVPGIKLHPRLGGEHLENPSGGWLVNARHQTKFAWPLVDDPILIVASGELELLVILIDAGPNRGWLSEIEWRALDWLEFASRD